MPDHIDPIPAVQGQTDWPAMLRDLEKRVETLSDALEGVKLSMRRLVLSEPWLEEAITTHVAEQPAYPAYMRSDQVQEPVASYEPPAPVASFEPVASYEAPEPVVAYEPVASYEAPEPVAGYEPVSSYEEHEPILEYEPVTGHEVPAPAVEPEYVQPAAVEYDEDAREAVRRAVEDAKAQMATGEWQDEPTDYVDEDKPEVSWITVPDDGSEPEPLPNLEDYATPEPVAEEEDPREAVRRAVEEAKAEMAYGGMTNEAPEAEAPVEDEEASREAVRRAVEEAKAEMGFATASNAPLGASPEDEEAAREAVRQAVAQTRAEMAGGTSLSSLMEGPRTEAPQSVERSPAFVVPPPHRPERIHPPTITIEDPEGRVELAAVYNLLKHLDRAANSSLLNYSSRQVSVQLSDSKTPDGETVAEAVRDVFERENNVQVDGLNVIVKLGANYIRAA